MGIDSLLSFTDHTTTNTYYTIKDHQNTVIALADENGDIVETYDYNAYGRTKVFSSSGTELTASAYGNRYTFQGREMDWETGLMYFRARWYNPEVGRWLSKDPIGISGGMNLYVFVSNNPVNYIDPSGLCAEEGSWNLEKVTIHMSFMVQNGVTKDTENFHATFRKGDEVKRVSVLKWEADRWKHPGEDGFLDGGAWAGLRDSIIANRAQRKRFKDAEESARRYLKKLNKVE